MSNGGETKQTVLIIEDDNDIREIYAEVLEDEGFNVLQAVDGDSGLETAMSANWDVMLLDIMLPKMDGIEILRELKKNDKILDQPIILLTNLGSEYVINECFDLGADGYLIKSQITPDKIVAEVRSYLAE